MGGLKGEGSLLRSVPRLKPVLVWAKQERGLVAFSLAWIFLLSEHCLGHGSGSAKCWIRLILMVTERLPLRLLWALTALSPPDSVPARIL